MYGVVVCDVWMCVMRVRTYVVYERVYVRLGYVCMYVRLYVWYVCMCVCNVVYV